MSSKLFFSTLFVFYVALGVADDSCSNDDYPELNPALQEYQDVSKCFPVLDTWFLAYRNYEYDEAMGGTAKCVSGTVSGPREGDDVPLLLHQDHDDDYSGEANLTLKSSEGYDAKNVMELRVAGNNDPVETYAAYATCRDCAVTRHPYITDAPGPACGLWVTYSGLGDDHECCDFIFDLLCGTTSKYQISDESCLDES